MLRRRVDGESLTRGLKPSRTPLPHRRFLTSFLLESRRKGLDWGKRGRESSMLGKSLSEITDAPSSKSKVDIRTLLLPNGGRHVFNLTFSSSLHPSNIGSQLPLCQDRRVKIEDFRKRV